MKIFVHQALIGEGNEIRGASAPLRSCITPGHIKNELIGSLSSCDPYTFGAFFLQANVVANRISGNQPATTQPERHEIAAIDQVIDSFSTDSAELLSCF